MPNRLFLCHGGYRCCHITLFSTQAFGIPYLSLTTLYSLMESVTLVLYAIPCHTPCTGISMCRLHPAANCTTGASLETVLDNIDEQYGLASKRQTWVTQACLPYLGDVTSKCLQDKANCNSQLPPSERLMSTHAALHIAQQPAVQNFCNFTISFVHQQVHAMTATQNVAAAVCADRCE
jgi:hypothetical protein